MKTKDTQTLALPNVSSTFALIGIENGRKAFANVVDEGYRVPFTISGFVRGWQTGEDDGWSTTFGADVTTAQFGTPELVSEDDPRGHPVEQWLELQNSIYEDLFGDEAESGRSSEEVWKKWDELLSTLPEDI
jgi:hypothetical protein